MKQLRYRERHAAVGAEVVDREQIRMRERRDRASLALEPRERLYIRRQVLREHLDGHFAVEPQVAGPVDLAHSSGAEGRENLVSVEERPRRERHAKKLSAISSQPSAELTAS